MTSSIHNWIKKDQISIIFEELNAGSNNSAHKIWNLLILSGWLKKWIN